MNKILTLSSLLLLCLLIAPTAHAIGHTPQDSIATTNVGRRIKIKTIVPKGEWIGGMNVSYTSLSADNYAFLIIEGASGTGYQFKVQPFLMYTFKDNLSAGLKFSYDRALLRIDNVGIDLGGSVPAIGDLYKLEHNYTATAVARQYVNMGDIKRFGFFTDLQLSLSGGQSKILNGKMENVTGTYQQTFTLGLGVSPGVVAFISKHSAVELSIGLLGIKIHAVKQIHNQVEHSSRSSAQGNFRIDIFSIDLGMALYL